MKDNPYLSMMGNIPNTLQEKSYKEAQPSPKPDASPRERKSFYVKTIHVDKILTIASNEGMTIANVLDDALCQFINGYEDQHGPITILPRKKIESRKK